MYKIIALSMIIFAVICIPEKSYCDVQTSKKIIVSFRCDDFFALENHSAKEFYETKERIIKIFEKHSVPLTIGVIPYAHNSLSKDTVPYKKLTFNDPLALLLTRLVNDRNFEIAQHGFTHLQNQISKHSEFLGLPFESQNLRIQEGKKILIESFGHFNLDTFIPPWNSFDLNTIKALKINGFKYLSGDVGIVKNRPFTLRTSLEKRYLDINLVPATCSLQELKNVLKIAKNDLSDTIIVVIFHPYDFQEYRKDDIKGKTFLNLKYLDEMLENIKNDHQLLFKRIKDINPEIVTSSRYTAACEYYMMLKPCKLIFPKIFLEHMGFTDNNIGFWMEKGRYLSEDVYKKLFFKNFMLLVVLCLSTVAIISFIFRGCLKEKLKGSLLIIFFTIYLVCLLFLEFRFEIITSPNMLGILLIYHLLFLSIFFIILTIVREQKE